MRAVRRREHLGELRDDRAGERAAGDDDGELPPQLIGEAADEEVADRNEFSHARECFKSYVIVF